MAIRVTSLHVYPVKSCAPIDLSLAELDFRGFRFDRRWMLVNARSGAVVTQRTCPKLALIRPTLENGDHLILEAQGMPRLAVPPARIPDAEFKLWDQVVYGVDEGNKPAQWLESFLGFECRLIRSSDTRLRPVDPARFQDEYKVGFADGYPFHLVSIASLDALNERLHTPVAMSRFRPNIVIDGCEAFEEDLWESVVIADVEFRLVKPCARCVLVNVDQHTAEVSKEPLATLANFRKVDQKVLFGQNAIHSGNGSISVGAAVIPRMTTRT